MKGGVAMPVNRAACELILDVELKAAETSNKTEESRETIRKFLSTKGKVKYGLINILDVLGAETLAAINSIAATVSDELIGSVSKLASNIFEKIVADILKMLLSYPNAIFSLVAIPHSAAVQASYDEISHLEKTKRDISYISYVINKWSKGYNGRRFYDQMKNAMPFIEEAITMSVDMINQLEGGEIKPGESLNAFFDERKYHKLQRNIQQAIKITLLDSIVNNRLQVTKQIENSRDERYIELSNGIIKEYKSRKIDLDKEYFAKIQDIEKVPTVSQGFVNSNITALRIDVITQKYSAEKNNLEFEKNNKLKAAKLKASLDASIDGSSYAKSVNGIVGEFNYDIRELGERLSSLVNNFKLAFNSYQEKQTLCNTLYHMRDFIRNLINEAINLLRKSGNQTAENLVNVIELAQINLGIVEDRFNDAIDRFETPDLKITATEMSAQVNYGHGVLSGSDASLHATITQSMIDLINSDDVLKSGDLEFNEFISRLAEIPDWDGSKNIWAVDIEKAVLSPYIQLVADSTSLLAKTPGAAASRDTDAQTRVKDLLFQVNAGFRRLRIHNTTVLITLKSYQPYLAPEGVNFINILRGSGLLKSFAETMSITNLALKLISNISKGGLDTTEPTHKNCAKEYPELFNNPDAAKAYALSNMDLPTPQFDMSWQENLEIDIDNINKAKQYVDSYNAIGDLDDEDLNSPPENTTSTI